MARIVFDLDGPLIDSNPSLAAAGNALLAELGRAPVTRGSAGFIGHGVARWSKGAGDTGGVPGGRRPHVAALPRNAADLIPAPGLPGVRDALAALAAAGGHGLAVCTQNPPALTILLGLGLMRRSPPHRRRQPRRAEPDRACSPTPPTSSPGPIVYVGDSEIDAATARSAGVPFLLYTEGYRLEPVAQLRHDAAFSTSPSCPRSSGCSARRDRR